MIDERLWLAARDGRAERHVKLLRKLAACVPLGSPFHIRVQDAVDGLELQVARHAVVMDRLKRG